MKIVIATESYPPIISGVAITTYLLTRSLAKEGHEIWVFCPATNYEDTDEVDPKEPKIHVCRCKSVNNPFRDDHRVSFRPKKRVERLMAKINPEVVHLQDPNGISTATFKVAEKMDIPVLITNHFSPEMVLTYVALGPLKSFAKKQLIKHLCKFYNKCDMIVTPTQTVADMVTGWGVTPEVKAVSNGVSLERFDDKPVDREKLLKKYHIPNNIPIVLYVGRIDKDKSMSVLIESVPKVLAQTNAHFVIVGKGGMKEKCEEMAEQLGVTKSITFTGAVEHDSDDFPQLFKMANLFVIPSEIETQSIVTLEAMAASLPIVAANAGALTELVHMEENGYLFGRGESDELAECVVKVLKNPDLATKFGKRSRVMAEPHQLENAHSQISDIYKALDAQQKN